MKRRLTRRRLVRPADAFLPLALLGACLCGSGMAAVFLCLCVLGARLCALSTAGSLRAAFALQPSMRDVQGSVKCALLAQPVGALLLAGILRCVSAEWLEPEGLMYIGAGLLLNLEHVFYEYLYSAGDGNSALLSRLITAALAFAGILLSGTQPIALPLSAGLAALAACAVSLASGGALKGRMNARPLRCAPPFMLQDALYPLCFAGLMLLLPRVLPELAPSEGTLFPFDIAFFAGLALYSLCRSAFRRSKQEARPMNVALAIVSAAAVLAALPALLLPGAAASLPAYAQAAPAVGGALLLAAACAFALFGNAGRAA